MRARLIALVAAALPSLASAQPHGAAGNLRLDGVDDAVTSRGEFLSQTVTIEAWLRPSSFHGQSSGGIVTYGSADRSSYGLAVGPATDPRLEFSINWNQGQSTVQGATPLTIDQWQHVAVTYDGATVRLYINGQLDAEQPLDAEILPSGAAAILAIGDDPGAGEPVGGRFDEVRVWSVARTAPEIQGAMGGAITGWEAGLLGYYDFNEVAGQVVLDRSRSGFHARLGNNHNPEVRDPARTWSGPTRMRALRLSSSDDVQVQPIEGNVDAQLAAINAGPPVTGWGPVVNRHADLHSRDQFPCGENLDRPYVDASPFLVGDDEVTLDNCGSAYYRQLFDLPPAFRRPAVIGTANGDDLAVAFLNRRPLSLLLTTEDVNQLGRDRIHTRHHLLGWPTPDPIFEDEVADLLVPGRNRLAFGVCSDASESEPAGLEYEVVVQYECLADWNIDGRNDTTDFTAFLNDWNPRKPETDINGDGAVNTQDVLLYINVWVFGCPE
ncbi:MAG TPA: LamG-like jellyroll fold domain-containing protein [Phycisphaerales bacterium]|nr:LamG-like jellyroll fold domain-containing protein [Phycisphaerales bacterium]